MREWEREIFLYFGREYKLMVFRVWQNPNKIGIANTIPLSNAAVR